MAVLTEDQRKNGYFKVIGGFPPAKIIHTVAEYDGSEQCCIACTQLDGRYSKRESKQILDDWIRFLRDEPTRFTALHFNSRVPQALFDAACCQRNLRELRLKWGSYGDLSKLTDLKHLQFLYLGSCPSAEDLSAITQLDALVVLYLENFNKIEDYSPLTKLTNLEQLVISGPTLKDIYIKDLDFVGDFPNLNSIWLPNTVIRKHYSDDERERLRQIADRVRGVYNQPWWK